jgi:hypothetical protein
MLLLDFFFFSPPISLSIPLFFLDIYYFLNNSFFFLSIVRERYFLDLFGVASNKSACDEETCMRTTKTHNLKKIVNRNCLKLFVLLKLKKANQYLSHTYKVNKKMSIYNIIKSIIQ